MIEARSGLTMRRILVAQAKQLFFYVIDFSVLFLAIISAYQIYRYLEIGKQVRYATSEFLPAAIVVSCTTVLVLLLSRAYESESSLLNVEETNRFVKGISLSALLISVVLVLSKIQLSRYVLLLSYTLSVFFIIVEKLCLYHVLPKTKHFSWMNRRVIIYGAGILGQSLFHTISNTPKLDIHPIGFVDDDPLLHNRIFCSSSYGHNTSSLTVLGTGADLKNLVENLAIDEIFVAISNINDDRLTFIRDQVLPLNVRISFVPNLHHNLLHKLCIRTIGQIPLVEAVENTPFPLYGIAKRIIDLLGAAFLLLLSLPLCLAIASAIRLGSRGPIFFSQVRVGVNGKKFNMLKFRSMWVESDPYAVSPNSHSDARVTGVGRWLRKTSLDELPQIINIIRGDMSFVGPRPEMPFIVEKYNELERERLKVLPGITGLWQLSGDRNRAIHENIDYDLYYVAHRSISLDIAIMLETVFFACRGK